jgi:hypothetical protein
MSTTPRNDPQALFAVSELGQGTIDWLWPGWFALGKLALLDGDPDLGKSLVALDLCARLSTGRPFPDGSPGSGRGCSLVLNGEDGGEDTVKPRLAAQGADLDRVFVLRPKRATGMPLLLPSGLNRLAWAVQHVRARLVVIDPFLAFLDPGIASGNDQSVRRALLPLARLAQRYRCAILMIRHLTKMARTSALYRGGGSIGLIGACRSAGLIAPDPLDGRLRVLAQVKNNLAPKQLSLGYELVVREQAPPLVSDLGPEGMPTPAGTPPDRPATVSWLGPSPWSADELLARQRPPHVSPRDRAREFLSAFLKVGPRTSRDIWTAALAQHLTAATLRRAKSELEIRTRRVQVAGRRVCYWLLPGQQLPAQAGNPIDPAATSAGSSPTPAPGPAPNPASADDSGDLEPWLAPLREQYPPLTPLDEL